MKNYKCFKTKVIVLFLIILFVGLAPFLVHLLFQQLEFNQFLLQKLEFKHNTHTTEITLDYLKSSYSSGLNIIFNKQYKNPSFYNEIETFQYVFSWVPSYAVVYPTEGFYYYTFKDRGGNYISGNIRLGEIDKGLISIAYFPIDETRGYKGKTITEEDGLLINKIDDEVYRLTFNGKSINFKMPFEKVEIPPKKMKLTPEEEFVGRLQDESGIRFFIIYNNESDSFYEVLNEEEKVTENLIEIERDFVIGERTGFLYYYDEDYNRKILVAIDSANSAENNYLDGPGDQFPINIDIKEKLNKAYPNTLLGNGTDEHGVYLNKTEWVRIAISPYDKYLNVYDIIEKRRICEEKLSDRTEFWTCLTKEWWNTREWRQGIISRLEEGGKDTSGITI